MYTVIGLTYIGNGHYLPYIEHVDAPTAREAMKIADSEYGEPYYVFVGELTPINEE